MAFITKEAIANHFNRCAEMLDSFDDSQIKAIHMYISILNGPSHMYDLDEYISRATILHYLVSLKVNKDSLDEHQIFNRIHEIHIAMAAMSLLGLEYNKN